MLRNGARVCLTILVLSIVLILPAIAETAIVMRVELMAAEDGKQRVVLNFTTPPDARLFVLRSPDRIALDLRDALPAGEPILPDEMGLVESVIHGATGPHRYRYIFHPKSGVEARLSRVSGSESTSSYEITFSRTNGVTVVAGEPRLSQESAEPAVVTDGNDSETTIKQQPGFTIVIDPGHGGDDNGAIAKSGVMEKDINLAAAKTLRNVLEENPGIRVVLTREKDEFVGLMERTEIARHENANLFISLHADSIRYKDLRGATIYTLSDRASDSLSLEIAANENAADRFGGEEYAKEVPEVFDILADLTRRETVSYSEHFASSLLARMRKSDIRFIKNPKRSAAFIVLKAPDVPSVLVELGFMSNVEDARLLADETWRTETMTVMAEAIVAFYGIGTDG
ncbi:n-acetylmuramoyl-l-alanine amidase protein [Fulvimarina pelagi HTCC2506]|uniref:N-acetylmuramoyl-L-alanine amidase n=2 Tax=Fulvimarina pelagi TaxID=217511 RepID=Q0G6Z7_9HYPH|nr:n-acetylmuramoyl-l-alanine amidase protein [Fulvimarina pelagi HTCC2506]